MKKIILASKSPRRHELLSMVGIEHEVITSDCDENINYSGPADMVCKLSELKAESVAQLLENNRLAEDDSLGIAESMKQSADDDSLCKSEAINQTTDDGRLIIGSDTIVYFDGEVLGKPKDPEDAFQMLHRMAGNTHSVFTGVTVIDTEAGTKETFYEETKVTFYDVSDDEIRDYIATGDPLDKAGSYGVQGLGAFLVKRIEGDYFTVVGLPLAHLIRVLKKLKN